MSIYNKRFTGHSLPTCPDSLPKPYDPHDVIADAVQMRHLFKGTIPGPVPERAVHYTIAGEGYNELAGSATMGTVDIIVGDTTLQASVVTNPQMPPIIKTRDTVAGNDGQWHTPMEQVTLVSTVLNAAAAGLQELREREALSERRSPKGKLARFLHRNY